jgi:FKBP-type peptidyl-prolyl cis-trans isomerase
MENWLLGLKTERRYQFIQKGEGKKAENGKTVSVHYMTTS